MRNTNLTRIAMVALVAAAPLAAQGGGRSMAGMAGMGDPTKQVVGTGTLPAGWLMRFDPAPAGKPAYDIKQINFITMAGGYHAYSGPAAIYYTPKDMGKGEFTVSATFHQAKSMQHETYGLFIAGARLQDSSQSYLYFVIRPQDGAWQVKRRASDAPPPRGNPVVDATIVKEDPKDGHATNTVAIAVTKDSVRFLVNGKEITALAKAGLGYSTDGQVGLRINHNLDVHIAGYALKK